MKSEIFHLLAELKKGQENTLLQMGRRLVPGLHPDDLLQPNDFEDLEQNPHFRYEEGVLHGIQAVEAALRYQFHNTLDNTP